MRIEKLARPKANLQKDFDGTRSGFVPHMHDLGFHMSQLHDTRTTATFKQKFDAAIKDLRHLLQIL